MGRLLLFGFQMANNLMEFKEGVQRMLTLKVSGEEFFNEETQEFTSVDDVVLELEHSLVSLSKWESKFRKAFLGPEPKTQEETLGYVEAMILNPNVSPSVLQRLDSSHFKLINDYIDSPQSATTFNNLAPGPRGRPEIITSELIYYWMIAFTIPFECENWHLNRLFALIQICNIKNSKQKKMSPGEIAARNHALNEQRKAKFGTTG